MKNKELWLKPLIVLVVLLGVAICRDARSEDGRAYFEPTLIIGSGEGRVSTDVVRHLDDRVKPFDFGLGVKALTPLSAAVSFTVDASYVFSKTNWAGFEKDRLRQFRIEVGMRFYLDKEK